MRDLIFLVVPTGTSVPNWSIGAFATLVGFVAALVVVKLAVRIIAAVAARRPAPPTAPRITIVRNAQE